MARRHDVIEHARRILVDADAAAEAVLALSPTRRSARAPMTEGLEAFTPAFEVSPVAEGEATELPDQAGGTPVERAIADERAQRLADGVQAMKKIETGKADEISPQEQTGLEAIILLTGRPAILIQEGDFMEPPKLWADLKKARAKIKAVIGRVGRIEVAKNPNFDWLGTGFLAGETTILTNRHVAMEFSQTTAPGAWTFRAPMTASLDLKAEFGSDESLEFSVTEIVGIHETYDLAVLRVEKTSSGNALPEPLPVAAAPPAQTSLVGRKVYVIGYPAWDGRRNDPEPMRRIFSEIYNVKRLQPGELSGEALAAFEILHDCSTLGGNSGSPVIDLETHRVLGLHFGGRYMEKNHAIPLWTLKADPLIKRAKLNFQ